MERFFTDHGKSFTVKGDLSDPTATIEINAAELLQIMEIGRGIENQLAAYEEPGAMVDVGPSIEMLMIEGSFRIMSGLRAADSLVGGEKLARQAVGDAEALVEQLREQGILGIAGEDDVDDPD